MQTTGPPLPSALIQSGSTSSGSILSGSIQSLSTHTSVFLFFFFFFKSLPDHKRRREENKHDDELSPVKKRRLNEKSINNNSSDYITRFELNKIFSNVYNLLIKKINDVVSNKTVRNNIKNFVSMNFETNENFKMNIKKLYKKKLMMWLMEQMMMA